MRKRERREKRGGEQKTGKVGLVDLYLKGKSLWKKEILDIKGNQF